MTYNIRLSNGEIKEVENVTDITLDKDGMCKVSVEGIDSAYLIFPKSKIELIELIDFWKNNVMILDENWKNKKNRKLFIFISSKEGNILLPRSKNGYGKYR